MGGKRITMIQQANLKFSSSHSNNVSPANLSNDSMTSANVREA